MDEEQLRGHGLESGARHYRAWVGPPEQYDLIAAAQFNLLTVAGLRDHHHLVDVGCGSLRAGRLLIPYLLPGRYCGIEPERWLVDEGIRNELSQTVISRKAARFEHGTDFPIAAFERQFDFILAQSILSHCHEDLVTDFFGKAAQALGAEGVVLATFCHSDAPAEGGRSGWVYPDIVEYRSAAMAALAADAGLEFAELDWPHPRQRWFVAARDRGRVDEVAARVAAAKPIFLP